LEVRYKEVLWYFKKKDREKRKRLKEVLGHPTDDVGCPSTSSADRFSQQWLIHVCRPDQCLIRFASTPSPHGDNTGAQLMDELVC